MLELYDELVIAIRCSRLFTGERFSAGPATLLLDGEKIIGVESRDVQALDTIITESLRRQLAAGVTTVRDLGDIRYAAVAGRPVRI